MAWTGYDTASLIMGLLSGSPGLAMFPQIGKTANQFGDTMNGILDSSSAQNQGWVQGVADMIQSDRSWNAEQAELDRDWQERMSNTSVQRAVKDIEAAGMNPYMLFAGSGYQGASTPSGASASGMGSSAMSSILGSIYSGNIKLTSTVIQSVTKAISEIYKGTVSGAAASSGK